MRIHVTGATGFIGRHFAEEATRQGHTVVALVRSISRDLDVAEQQVIGDMAQRTDWSEAVAGADVVVHLAARVHVMNEDSADPDQAYTQANVTPTVSLAQAAADAGVRKFVFMSSIKVNGEKSLGGPFTSTSEPCPVDPYARSKHAAEIALARVAERSMLDVVILRPTVVYGAGVGGNILRIAEAVNRGLPLPLGSIRNRRSMVAVENVVTALIAGLQVEGRGSSTYLVSDEEPVSTRSLVEYLASGLGKKPRLLPAPAGLLRLGGRLIRREADIQRLIEDFEVIPDWARLGVSGSSLVSSRAAFVELGRSIAHQEG